MSVPVDLDPKEVLEHLWALGYDNITKSQLQQFIKDLKKLIKHDLRKIEEIQEAEKSPSSESCKRCCESPRVDKVGRRVLKDINQAEKPYDDTRSRTIAVQTLVPPRDIVSTSSNSDSSEISDLSSKLDSASLTCPVCKSNSCNCPQLKAERKKKKENTPPKPVSSFIRVAPGDSRLGKTDPVTLYHYYQSLWARHNRPGENPHADVRWRIRHKMMAPAAMKTSLEKKRENPPWVD